jgi:hypothetical protein
MTPYLRGKKKQNIFLANRTPTPAQDADHGAMAGGGGQSPANARGRGLATKDSTDTPTQRKRKRGSNSQDMDKEEMSLDEPNDDNQGISDEIPQLGMHSFNVAYVDATGMAKLVAVIEHQFSLEILLKNQERKTIEAEKAKVETSLKQLEQCVLTTGTSLSTWTNVDETHDSQRFNNYYGQYIDYGSRPQHNGNTLPPTSSRPQRNAAIKAASRSGTSGNICWAKNDQGRLVR